MTSKSTASIIAELRELAGVSQNELAQRSGVAQPNISFFEKGTKECSFGMLKRFAEALDFDIEVTLVPREVRRELVELRRQRIKVLRMGRGRGAYNLRIVTNADLDDDSVVIVVDLNVGRDARDVELLADDFTALMGRPVTVLSADAGPAPDERHGDTATI